MSQVHLLSQQNHQYDLLREIDVWLCIWLPSSFYIWGSLSTSLCPGHDLGMFVDKEKVVNYQLVISHRVSHTNTLELLLHLHLLVYQLSLWPCWYVLSAYNGQVSQLGTCTRPSPTPPSHTGWETSISSSFSSLSFITPSTFYLPPPLDPRFIRYDKLLYNTTVCLPVPKTCNELKTKSAFV